MDYRVRHLRIEQWKKLLEAQAASGLTKQEWCVKNNISRDSFFYWQKIIRDSVLSGEDTDISRRDEDSSGFAELFPASESSTPAGPSPAFPGHSSAAAVSPSGISITCGRFAIHLEGSVNEETLACVLKVVSHAD